MKNADVSSPSGNNMYRSDILKLKLTYLLAHAFQESDHKTPMSIKKEQIVFGVGGEVEVIFGDRVFVSSYRQVWLFLRLHLLNMNTMNTLIQSSLF
jgi:hypothetical protein